MSSSTVMDTNNASGSVHSHPKDKKSTFVKASKSINTSVNKLKNTSRQQLLTNNHSLANRLNKKKIETKKLRDVVKKLNCDVSKYRRFINHLMLQRERMQSAYDNILKSFPALCAQTSAMVAAAAVEFDLLKKTVENVCKNDYNEEDGENLSYLANTSLMDAMKQAKVKRPLLGKSKNKVVNMVRPMKCGYVVGHPVVSLRRLRRSPMVPVSATPLMSVTEDTEEESEEEEEEEEPQENGASSDNVSDEIVPTPSGLPSPSSPEPASTQTSPTSSLVSSNGATPRARASGLRPQPVAVHYARSPEDEEEDSIRRCRPAPKSKKKNSFTPNTPKSSNCSQQRKTSSLENNTPNRRATFLVSTSPGHQSLKTPKVKYTISKDQQVQLKTPCRVMMLDVRSANDCKTPTAASPLSPLVRAPSPMMPVVILDRITKRKKPKLEPISDIEEEKEESPESPPAQEQAPAPLDQALMEQDENDTMEIPCTKRMASIVRQKLELSGGCISPAIRVLKIPQIVKTEPSDKVLNESAASLDCSHNATVNLLGQITMRKNGAQSQAECGSDSNAKSAAAAAKGKAATPSPNKKLNQLNDMDMDLTLLVDNNTTKQKDTVSPSNKKSRANDGDSSFGCEENFLNPKETIVPTKKTSKSDDQASSYLDSAGNLSPKYKGKTRSSTERAKPVESGEEKSPKLKKLKKTCPTVEKSKPNCTESNSDKVPKPKKLKLPSKRKSKSDVALLTQDSDEENLPKVKGTKRILSKKKVSKYDKDADLVPHVVDKQTPRRYRPMPLSKKIKQQQQQQQQKYVEPVNETSDEEGSGSIKKKIAYENEQGCPGNQLPTKDTQKMLTKKRESEKEKECHSSEDSRSGEDTTQSDRSPPQCSSSQEWQDSNDSCASNSSNKLSPAERKLYMKEFMDRVKREDPLEGTSKKFEPKKQPSKTVNLIPCKKSLRLHKKTIAYNESPNATPPNQKVMDESWRPLVKKTKPKRVTKKTK